MNAGVQIVSHNETARNRLKTSMYLSLKLAGTRHYTVWFFERGDEVLELETHYDDKAAECILELRGPNLAPITERFTDRAEFRTRLLAIERDLTSQRWRQTRRPVVLPNGWRHHTRPA